MCTTNQGFTSTTAQCYFGKMRSFSISMGCLVLGLGGASGLVACGSDGGSGGSAGESSAGESAQGGQGSGGKSSGGSTSAGSAGKSGGTAGGSTGGAPGGFDLDDSGKDALDGKDGITGIASGMEFTRTMNVKAQVDWEITMPSKVGVYGCQAQGGPDSAFITLNNHATSNIRGTSVSQLGGACAFEVTQITPSIEGRFAGVLIGIAASKTPVVGGYFHIAESPIGDCSNADDPGVPAGMNGATISVTKIEAQGKEPWRCGSNSTLAWVSYNQGQISYHGKLDTKDFDLAFVGLKGVGKATCGMNGVKLSSGLIWGGDNGGTCNIDVTKFDDTGIEGTYEAAMWNGITAAHSTVTFTGSFRSTGKEALPF